MTPLVERLSDWLENEVSESYYLSHKENWTPRLKRVAREFYIVGIILGATFGCVLGWIIWGKP